MNRFLATGLVCLLMSGLGGGVASAKSCRDAHGKFMKCPSAMMAPTKKCRDKKGRFTKCSSMSSSMKMKM